MEDVALKIRLDAAESAKSVSDLKKSIIDLKNGALEAAAAGNSALSAAYTQGAAKAKDKINDLNKEIDILGDSGSKIQAVAKVGSVIAQGFAAAQGAAALFGASSEDVQKQLLKVQAAMALIQGFQGFAEGAKVVKLFATQTGLATVATELFGATAATSMALATAGITVIIAGVVTLISTFDSWKNSIGNATPLVDKLVLAHRKLKPVLEDISKIRATEIVNTQSQLDLAKAQGKSAKDLYDIEVNLLNLKIAQAKLQAQLTLEDIFASEKAKTAALKTYQDLTTQKIALNVSYNKTLGADWKKESDTQQKLTDQKLSDEEKIFLSSMNTYDQKIYNLKKEFDAFIADGVDRVKAEQWLADQITLISVQQAKDEMDALAKLKQEAAAQKTSESAGAGVQDGSIREIKEAEELEKAKWEARYRIAQQFTSSLISLNNVVTDIELKNAHGNEAKMEQIRKQSFERNKSFQIVNAIISGIQGVQSVLAGQANKALGPIGIALDAIEISGIVATTAENVSRIRQSQYTGGGSSASISATTPSANGVGLNNPVQQSSLLNQAQNQQANVPQKVYVVESDITAAQGRIASIVDKGIIK